MKRASYREAIRWIADNDNPSAEDANDPDAVSYLVSSVLVADIFGVEPLKVGTDVARERRRSDG